MFPSGHFVAVSHRVVEIIMHFALYAQYARFYSYAENDILAYSFFCNLQFFVIA